MVRPNRLSARSPLGGVSSVVNARAVFLAIARRPVLHQSALVGDECHQYDTSSQDTIETQQDRYSSVLRAAMTVGCSPTFAENSTATNMPPESRRVQ